VHTPGARQPDHHHLELQSQAIRLFNNQAQDNYPKAQTGVSPSSLHFSKRLG
jgi:hypothetical protein